VIAVDAMGGDHAPGEIIAGALAAQREHGIRVLLTGPAARSR
jgi:phosphate acyltransferase